MTSQWEFLVMLKFLIYTSLVLGYSLCLILLAETIAARWARTRAERKK